jgi:integrase
VSGIARSLHAAEVNLVEHLAAELRPEFAEDVIFVDASDAVMGGPACRAARCERTGVILGMCSAHHQTWSAAGRPDLEDWAASAPPSSRWLGQPPRCSAPSCHRGSYMVTLCHVHHLRWRHAGFPDRAVWTAEHSGPLLKRTVSCALSHCLLDGEGRSGLCRTHRTRWARHGRPPVAEYVLSCESFGRDRFDLRALPMPMRIEIAYSIQRRVDERRTKTRPDLLRRLLNQLPESGATSLLDRSPETWTSDLGFSTDRGSVSHRFLLDAIGYLADIVEGVGWDAEYPRDVWLLRRIGFPGRDKALRFDRIGPLWLRSLTKRWARWRLSTGISIAAVVADVRAITRLSESCPSLQRGPEALTRQLIEAHLANLATLYPNAKTRTGQIGSLAGLLLASRQHGWEPRLGPRAEIYTEDYPRREVAIPRALPEVVMSQLESEENLRRFGDLAGRLLMRILMATGLRVGDGCRLRLDCIVRDGQGAPYLRYTNHKMRREALVPISPELEKAIKIRQDAVTTEFPDGHYLLPRQTRNPDGHVPFSTATFRGELIAWLHACDVRDQLGRPVHVTPHQWRHTYGTRLINSDVPQETVRRLLDHESHQMTSHYARLSDRTIRDQWERARKVNVSGDELATESGPLAEAVWMNNNVTRAKMALPNGYCTLPLQQRCEYANACLTCPVFVTTVKFLPQHRRQLESTRALIDQAEREGHQRMTEMNRTVERNLQSIIAALSHDETNAESSGDPSQEVTQAIPGCDAS